MMKNREIFQQFSSVIKVLGLSLILTLVNDDDGDDAAAAFGAVRAMILVKAHSIAMHGPVSSRYQLSKCKYIVEDLRNK